MLYGYVMIVSSQPGIFSYTKWAYHTIRGGCESAVGEVVPRTNCANSRPAQKVFQTFMTHEVCLRKLQKKLSMSTGLDNLKSAFELLDRRSGSYSDRLRLIVAQEILKGGLLSSLMNHCDR